MRSNFDPVEQNSEETQGSAEACSNLRIFLNAKNCSQLFKHKNQDEQCAAILIQWIKIVQKPRLQPRRVSVEF